MNKSLIPTRNLVPSLNDIDDLLNDIGLEFKAIGWGVWHGNNKNCSYVYFRKTDYEDKDEDWDQLINIDRVTTVCFNLQLNSLTGYKTNIQKSILNK